MEQGQHRTPARQAGARQDGEKDPGGTPADTPGQHWGQGAASALDSLRQRNYRGRRSRVAEDRPAAE